MNLADERLELHKIIQNGFGGVLPGSGMLVDRRTHPDAIPIQKNELLNAPVPKNLHTCVACNKTDAWSDEWQWFGSMKDFERGKPVIKVCSAECFKKYESRNKEL